MRVARALALVAALTLVAPASAQTAPAAPTQLASAEPSNATPLASLPDERMTVAVNIGGTGPYSFIVDTAAERSVISSQLARELSLEPAGSARLLSMTVTRAVDRVHMRDVSFIPGPPRDLRAFVVNGDNIGAPGVLGIDALRGQRVVLDFQANTMTVSPAPPRPEYEPGVIVVRARDRVGQLVLAESTVNGVAVDVIVDSGLDVSVGNPALRRLLQAHTSQFHPIALHSITGEALQAEYTVVDEFRIARLRLSNLPVAFADAHVFRRLRMTRRPALLLGMQALRLFERVSIDFPNQRASFVMREN